MALSQEQLVLMLILYRRRKKRLNKYRKRYWVRRIFTERESKGAYHSLVQECKLYDHEFFFQMFRMSTVQLEERLQKVSSLIVKLFVQKKDFVLLSQYLASGNSHVSLAAAYRISQTSIGRIIQET